MRGLSLALALMAAGCGFSEERFLVKGVDRWCEQSAACAGVFDKEACIDVFRSTDRSGCTYDEEAASECYSVLPEAQCIDDDVLGIRYLEVPEACEAVYDCPEE
ncbi:MAG: hypothetical protein R3F61_03985 [Myxococcota bacterium]